MLFGGRYIVLLMGIFSIYTGLIYNDIFSKGMEIFESGFDWVQVSPTIAEGEFNNNTYPIGIDIAWHGTDNFLVFTNSYKMKMSVIFGVIQMTFGLVLSLFNHLHFKNMVSVWHEFVPQLIFLQVFFFFWNFLLKKKIFFFFFSRSLVTSSSASSTSGATPGLSLLPPRSSQCSLTCSSRPARSACRSTMVSRRSRSSFSSLHSLPSLGCSSYDSFFFFFLLLLLLICLFLVGQVKPLYLRSQAAKHEQFHAVNEDEDEEAADGSHAEGGDHGGHGHGGHFDFGEVFIHQVIHTIEFCLGCISNTASYLRLWALSLAHARTSFFNFIVLNLINGRIQSSLLCFGT